MGGSEVFLLSILALIVRQHMYALLQCEEIVEFFRHGLIISGVKVSSKRLPGEFHKPYGVCAFIVLKHISKEGQLKIY